MDKWPKTGKRQHRFVMHLAVGIQRDYVDQNSRWYYVGDNRTDITIPRPEYDSGMLHVTYEKHT